MSFSRDIWLLHTFPMCCRGYGRHSGRGRGKKPLNNGNYFGAKGQEMNKDGQTTEEGPKLKVCHFPSLTQLGNTDPLHTIEAVKLQQAPVATTAIATIVMCCMVSMVLELIHMHNSSMNDCANLSAKTVHQLLICCSSVCPCTGWAG